MENANYNDMELLLAAKAKLLGRPVKATLELSPLCNMNCKMCYIRHSIAEANAAGGIKPVSFWVNLIPQFKAAGILFVALIGGEPFLYPEFRELYEKIYDNGFLVNITTNATLIDESVIEWLKVRPPRYITVSLYGASDETYKLVTGDPNGFSKTIAGLELLRTAGIDVKLNFVTLPQNKNDLHKIFDIKNHYDLPLLAAAYTFPATRRGKPVDYERICEREAAECLLKIKKDEYPERYDVYIQKVATKGFRYVQDLHCADVSCKAGQSTFWVDWQGNMIPCGFIDKIKASLVENSVESCWEKVRNEVKQIRTSSACSTCEKREFCQVCTAAMLTETGKYDGTPTYLCKMTEELVILAKEEIEKKTIKD